MVVVHNRKTMPTFRARAPLWLVCSFSYFILIMKMYSNVQNIKRNNIKRNLWHYIPGLGGARGLATFFSLDLGLGRSEVLSAGLIRCLSGGFVLLGGFVALSRP